MKLKSGLRGSRALHCSLVRPFVDMATGGGRQVLLVAALLTCLCIDVPTQADDNAEVTGGKEAVDAENPVKLHLVATFVTFSELWSLFVTH